MERIALRRPLGSPTPASGAVSDSSQRVGEIYLTFKTRNGLGRTRRRRVPTLPPENEFPAADAMSSHPYLKTARYGVRHVQHSERSQTPSRGVASGFLNVTRFESDLGAVDLAIDLVITIDEADILGLGATLKRAGAAAQLEILDEDDGIAVGQDGSVGVLDDSGAVGSRSALP